MTESPADDPATLLARAAKLKVFAVLRHTRDPQRLKEMLTQHLHWIASEERSGMVFLSGPMTNGGGPHPDGLTIVRAADLNAAEALIRQDPLIAAGVVAVDVCEWTLNEGSIGLRLHLSDSTFSLS